MNGLPDKAGETRKDRCLFQNKTMPIFKRLKSLVLNPVFRWVCFAVFRCAVMFDR